MQFKRVIDLLILAAMVLCFTSAATAADADGWYPAPVTQTVYYPQPTTVYYTQPAAAIGTINSVGNLGGFVGPSIFGYLSTSTGRYDTGLWILAVCMFLAGVLATHIRVPRQLNQPK